MGIIFERCMLYVCLVGGADSSYVCMYVCVCVLYVYTYTIYLCDKTRERKERGKQVGRTCNQQNRECSKEKKRAPGGGDAGDAGDGTVGAELTESQRLVEKGLSQTSVDAGSASIKTLYSLLLIAGPTFRSVSAPLRFADFCHKVNPSALSIPLPTSWGMDYVPASPARSTAHV